MGRSKQFSDAHSGGFGTRGGELHLDLEALGRDVGKRLELRAGVVGRVGRRGAVGGVGIVNAAACVGARLDGGESGREPDRRGVVAVEDDKGRG